MTHFLKKYLKFWLLNTALVLVFGALTFLNSFTHPLNLTSPQFQQSITKIVGENSTHHNHLELIIEEEEEGVLNVFIHSSNLKKESRTIFNTVIPNYNSYNKPFFHFLTSYLYLLLSFF